MAEIKTIRLTEEEYNQILVARDMLLNYGINSLPKEHRESIKEMQEEHGRFTMGFVVSVCATMLINTLAAKKY